jgi:hypothetical protein
VKERERHVKEWERQMKEGERQAKYNPTYEGSDIHCTWFIDRTLDETHYPGLDTSTLEQRNNDQVVTHSTGKCSDYGKETDAKKFDPHLPLLCVPQAWIWVVQGTVVSADNSIMDYHTAPVDETLEENYKAENIRWRLQDVGKFQSELLSYEELRTKLEGHPNVTRRDYLAFNMMAGCGQLAHVLSNYVNEFGRMSSSATGPSRTALDHFEIRIASILSEAHEYVHNGEADQVSYEKERYFILVVSDVRSELAMILYVFQQQDVILDDLIRMFRETGAKLFHTPDPPLEITPGVQELRRAKDVIAKFRRRTIKIDDDAERIERSIQDMLNLKRTHASMKDAHSSLILSTAVIGFTVVTIVFAPLAFLTALFALKVQGFDKLQVAPKQETPDGNENGDADGVYHSGKLGGIFGELQYRIDLCIPCANES